MPPVYENAVEWFTDQDVATVTVCQPSLARKIEASPDVRVMRRFDENDGCLVAQVPLFWVNIKPKKKRVMSEEQRAVNADRLRKMRKERTNESQAD